MIDFAPAEWGLLQASMNRLGLSENSWLCRGAVRCSLLAELQDWDDFDVMTEASEEELRDAMQRSGVFASRTFHGGYSFQLANGRKIDVWSLSWTAGRKCTSLADALSAFEFNVDAIAKSIRSGEIEDPLGVRSEILGRKLKLLSETEISHNAYLPLKAAYLVLRHKFKPDGLIAKYWLRNPEVDDLPPKAVPALQAEIYKLGVRRSQESVQTMAREFPGLEVYIDLLVSD